MPKLVDLGLPSGNLWADRNIGAAAISNYGYYFSWGNTVGRVDDGSYMFDLDNYSVTPGASVDGTLSGATDAATVILGDGWSMPSQADYAELVQYTERQWRLVGDSYGLLFTSTVNGRSIFMPAAGFIRQLTLRNANVSGDYWTSDYSSVDKAGRFYLASGQILVDTVDLRYYGLSIRAIVAGQ